MENEQPTDQQQQPAQPEDESVEEFKDEVEQDPSTASSPNEDAERLRGG
jgi:hypothetical protein